MGRRLGARSRTAAHGLLALGVEPGDRVVDPRRGPTRVDRDRPRHRRRARHHGRVLPHQPRRRGAVPAPGLRRHACTSPRTRSSSTRSTRSAARIVARSAHDHLRRAPRHGRARPTTGWCSGTRSSRWVASTSRSIRTRVADRMAAATDDDVMTLVYTSGTTGPPKGAMLTNKNAAFCIDKIVNADERVPGGPPNPKDQIVTYLPAVPRGRADLLDLDDGRRRTGAQLRRVDRDGQREPPRGAADDLLRRAPDLGEAARRCR